MRLFLLPLLLALAVPAWAGSTAMTTRRFRPINGLPAGQGRGRGDRAGTDRDQLQADPGGCRPAGGPRSTPHALRPDPRALPGRLARKDAKAVRDLRANWRPSDRTIEEYMALVKVDPPAPAASWQLQQVLDIGPRNYCKHDSGWICSSTPNRQPGPCP
jgi:hypothetical protein